MDKPLLIYFIGTPGSGKTYFGARLAKELSAVHLSSDATRIAMFGSSEEVERIRSTKQEFILYKPVFGALDYVASQTLKARHSVIYDAQMNRRRDRKRMQDTAEGQGAVPVLVWIETPTELAIERGHTREMRDDSIPYSEEKMRWLVDHFGRSIDLPKDDENLIKISGELEFSEQYASFMEQLNGYTKGE